jgi:peptide/nickel transport system substrate-binding protein
MGLARCAASLGVAVLAALGTTEAAAQKPGGTLRLYHWDSPPSLSIHEEVTVSTLVPMMGVFNNLVTYDPQIATSRIDTVRPDLATSWEWRDGGRTLVLKLRHGVKWHDGEPFTAADVKCTWDLLTGRGAAKLRLNPRKAWYENVDDVTADADDVASFHLKRPQPALLALLASGYSPVYPCHVSPQQMRQHPIGTGPFKFLEFKPNESVKVVRNPDYWKPGRPYLDGIDFTIITNRSTAMLAFESSRVDMTFPFNVTVPLMGEVKGAAPDATCMLEPTGTARGLLLNRTVPPFDDPDFRRALALSLDRKAFIDILSEGQDLLGGLMTPPPEGSWGLPSEVLKTLPGYDPDVAKSRAEARGLMECHGYSPDHLLPVKVSTRNLPEFRDSAVVLIDQLKTIYIDAQLELIETASWFTRLSRKDYQLALFFSLSSVDDPDQQLYENYTCGAERNYTGFCNHDLERRFDEQSMEPDQAKRQRMVWEIDRELQEDVVKPIIAHTRLATCWHKAVKGLTIPSNSIANGWRFEDVWLDR